MASVKFINTRTNIFYRVSSHLKKLGTFLWTEKYQGNLHFFRKNEENLTKVLQWVV